MKQITFKAVHRNGHVIEITGYPTGTPGLVVNEDFDNAGWWFVTHARSGCVIDYAWGSPEAALACAQAIADLCDWRASAEEIRTNSGPTIRSRIIEIGDRLNGLPCTGLGHRPLDNGVIA